MKPNINLAQYDQASYERPILVIYAFHQYALDSFLICMSFASFESNQNKSCLGQ